MNVRLIHIRGQFFRDDRPVYGSRIWQANIGEMLLHGRLEYDLFKVHVEWVFHAIPSPITENATLQAE